MVAEGGGPDVNINAIKTVSENLGAVREEHGRPFWEKGAEEEEGQRGVVRGGNSSLVKGGQEEGVRGQKGEGGGPPCRGEEALAGLRSTSEPCQPLVCLPSRLTPLARRLTRCASRAKTKTKDGIL